MSYSDDTSCSETSFSSCSSSSGSRCRIKPGIYSELPPEALPVQGYPAYTSSRVSSSSQTELTVDAPINPISNLMGEASGNQGSVKMTFRRRNKVVVMQWEPFSGLIGGTGIKYVSAGISFGSLPVTPIEKIIRVNYKGVNRIGYININRHSPEHFKFYIDHADDVISYVGDRISVPGGSVTWITSD